MSKDGLTRNFARMNFEEDNDRVCEYVKGRACVKADEYVKLRVVTRILSTINIDGCEWFKLMSLIWMVSSQSSYSQRRLTCALWPSEGSGFLSPALALGLS